MLWDTHMHTSFSGDSDAAPEDMIKKALSLGLNGICITDHMDLDYPDDPELFLLDPNAYFPALTHLQNEYHSTLPVRIGIELGLQPHLSDTHRNLVYTHNFDFVIGSSHVVHGMDPYYPAYYEGRTEEEAYYEYFTSIIENIRAFDDFDVYGHIDYVVRYGPDRNKNYSYAHYRDVIDEILKLLIEKGKGIEINTGGYRCGLGHPNPTEDILKRYRELGGEIITLGSDAHKPEDIAYDFRRIPAILHDCGFAYYTVFKERKPVFIKL
ncbi:MAG: histidinol-phosphatase HisJ family protein [Clostridiales bacterium]|nr:histidinol-phosphatase HisJ family protein [Clostridiales bacterium]